MKWLSKGRASLVGSGAILAALAGGSALSAQAVQDGAAPLAGFDSSAGMQVLGKIDESVRRPTTIVNGVTITAADVDQRLALDRALNQMTNLPADDIELLRRRELRSLIDEVLEIEHAKADGIVVTLDEIEQGFAHVAAEAGQSPGTFGAYLRSVGASDRSLRREIEVALAWRRFLEGRVEPYTRVGGAEVQGILERIEASTAGEEYHLKQIFLSAGPDRTQQVFAQARRMIEDIQRGVKPFEYFAQLSDTGTPAGGDLGWLSESQLDQLPGNLASATRTMTPGEIAGPIALPGGFAVLQLVDTRRVIEADPLDSRLSLEQLSISLASSPSEADGKARLQAFAAATSAIRGCGEASATAAAIGAQLAENDSVLVRDLPLQLQRIMLELKVGQSSPPFGSLHDAVRALLLCGRDGAAQAPRQAQQQAEMALRADRTLRDLRRNAIIEYH